ncbi:hypothetical protein NM208_g15683 [Fusarium decemcellulare]|uniref:Uncharacterized protein n=1 Tax=Fusarium decemcellulare TaxID=57161 RepID=A0ACC1RCA9_9HYPO|nr:hypothetical protein NM208_g15683 [Fusarium decemcellulare]
MPSGHRADGTYLCKPCNLIFSTWDALHRHKGNMRRAGKKGHVHCKFCSEDFKTEGAEIKHIQQNHPQEQNLDCPGCGKGPFVRLGGLMSHIQQDCPSLDISGLENLRESKLEFSNNLTALTKDKVKNNYTAYMPSSYGGSICDSESKAESFVLEENAFPALSSADPRASKREQENVAPWEWNEEKNLFPEAPPAQKPTTEQLKAATAPNARALYEAMDPHDPSHPGFNVARYYSPYMDKYGCPVTGCGKTFKASNGLVAHLKSTAHSGTKYRCPYCLRTFNSLVAITQHAESNGSRCKIRETDAYTPYLDQLTAGMVDIAIDNNDDGTVKYQISKTFRRGEALDPPKVNPKEKGEDPWEGKELHW